MHFLEYLTKETFRLGEWFDVYGYAKQRLENTNDPTTNICLDSGFESQRTFNRVFKEKYMVSPSEYRRKLYEDLEKVIL